jgi:hypothetical protein
VFAVFVTRKLKSMAYVGMGIALSLGLLFFLPQFFIYNTPFQAISTFSHMNTPFYPNQYLYTEFFYAYVVLPLGQIGTLKSSTAEPYSNLGILAFIFVASNIFLFYKKNKSIVPYTVALVVVLLYLTFGSQSIFSYVPIFNINRLLIPSLVLFSIGSALFVKELKKNILLMIVPALLLVYLFASLAFYSYSISYNTLIKSVWVETNLMSSYLKGSVHNLQNYSLYQNYTSLAAALCFTSGIKPADCHGSASISSAFCNQSYTIIATKYPFCGNGYEESNSSFPYYLYINRGS